MTNLPDFPGASVVYARAARVARHLNQQAYFAQRTAYTKKRGFRFSPPAEAEHIIRALNVGDEETLKACVNQYLTVALAEDA